MVQSIVKFLWQAPWNSFHSLLRGLCKRTSMDVTSFSSFAVWRWWGNSKSAKKSSRERIWDFLLQKNSVAFKYCMWSALHQNVLPFEIMQYYTENSRQIQGNRDGSQSILSKIVSLKKYCMMDHSNMQVIVPDVNK